MTGGSATILWGIGAFIGGWIFIMAAFGMGWVGYARVSDAMRTQPRALLDPHDWPQGPLLSFPVLGQASWTTRWSENHKRRRAMLRLILWGFPPGCEVSSVAKRGLRLMRWASLTSALAPFVILALILNVLAGVWSSAVAVIVLGLCVGLVVLALQCAVFRTWPWRQP